MALSLLLGGLIAVMIWMGRDRPDSPPASSSRAGPTSELVLFDGIDNEEALKSIGWAAVGDVVGIVSDAELRFVNDVDVIQTFDNRTSAAVRLPLADTGGFFDVPPSRWGYVVNAPAAAMVLRERLRQQSIESRAALPTPSDVLVVSTVADIPRGSTWTVQNESLAFSTARPLQFPRGVRVLASGRGPLIIQANNGLSLEVPAGEFGYIVQPKEF